MTQLLQRFLRDECGATAIEYAVIASMLSIVIVSAVGGLGSKLKTSYTAVAAGFN
jgi:pilus assembly protein Flp/PilA